MLFRLRFALMWLLLLALPLQGFAAATMLHCGPGHHGMAAGAAVAHQSADDSDHHHGEAGHVHAATHASGSDDHAPTAADISKLSKFKCSACASCCLGLALPAAVTAFTTFAPADAPDFRVRIEPFGFFTDGPDRPPRLRLA